jgi:Cytochrome P450
MVDYLISHPSDNDKTIDGLRTIAINVLGHSGYGQSRTWTPKAFNPSENQGGEKKNDLTYFDAIYLVTIQLLEAAFIPTKIMQLPFMPKSLRLLGEAMEDFPRKTKELLNEERREQRSSNEARGNFLSMMVQLSDKEGQAEAKGKTLSLTESEIQGNLFVFSAAGFDTTANTMGYGVTMLALYPEWQDWIKEELRSLDLDSDIEAGEYEALFPKCQRVLAVMVSSPSS